MKEAKERKTNFILWVNHYNTVLLPYYHRFCYLFPRGEEPDYTQFLYYCFMNTKQNYHPQKRMFIAPIY